MRQYEKKQDENGQYYLETDLPGMVLTRLPLLNKSTAFTLEERREFGILGMFPTHVSTLEEQVERAYVHFRGLATDLDRHIYLRALQDRSEVQFYALLDRRLEELLPIIYTPTVGLRRSSSSAGSTATRAASWSAPRNIDSDRVSCCASVTVSRTWRLIVVDRPRRGILGIGDQGLGRDRHPIGKLSIYTAARRDRPRLPSRWGLDVGTNRQDLLDDPLYLGCAPPPFSRARRTPLTTRFVQALRRRFPDVLLQWEDFRQAEGV